MFNMDGRHLLPAQMKWSRFKVTSDSELELYSNMRKRVNLTLKFYTMKEVTGSTKKDSRTLLDEGKVWN